MRLQKGELDLDSGKIRGTSIRLTTTELRLVRWLAAATEPATTSTLLAEVWGYRPTVRSRTVYSTIERLRRKLEVDASNPRHLLKEPQGYRLVASPLRAELPEGFLGRRAIARELEDRLGAGGAIGIRGPAGVGKTRLARIAFDCFADRFRESVWVDLRGVTKLGGAHERIARALELPNAGHGQRMAALQSRAPVLIVLDDTDDLGLRASDLIESLEADVDRVVLTTGRSRVEGVDCLVLPGLEPWVCRQLLRGAGVTTLDDTALDVAAASLDHLPLALELAAPWLVSLDADALRMMPNALPGLQGALQRSWDITPEPLRTWIAALAVVGVESPIDLALELGPANALERLNQLMDRSLVHVSGGQVVLLETVRSLALVRAEHIDETRERALDWAHRTLDAANADIGTREQRKALARIRRQLDVLVGILQWRSGSPKWSQAVVSLVQILTRIGLIPSVDEWVEELVARARTPEEVAWSQISQSLIRERRGGDCLSPLMGNRPAPDTSVGAAFHQRLATALLLNRRFSEAEVVFQILIDAWPETALTTRRARFGLAKVCRGQDRLDACLSHLTELERLATIGQDDMHRAVALGTRGQIERARGNTLHAEIWMRQARELSLELEERSNAAHTSHSLGALCAMQGRPNEGRKLLREALAYYRHHGLIQSYGFVHTVLALVGLWSGDPSECEAELILSDQAFMTSGFEAGLRMNHAIWGRMRMHLGQFEAAQDRFDRAVCSYPPTATRERALLGGLRAICAQLLGRPDEQATQVYDELPDDAAGHLIRELLDSSRGPVGDADFVRRAIASPDFDATGG